MQQRATGGIKPVAAVARTQSLYVGRLLYHLSHRAPQHYGIYEALLLWNPSFISMIVFLGLTLALSSAGPSSATLLMETFCWRTTTKGWQSSQSAAGGEGVDQRKRKGQARFSLWRNKKGKRGNSFNGAYCMKICILSSIFIDSNLLQLINNQL